MYGATDAQRDELQDPRGVDGPKSEQPDIDEVSRLRKENARLQQENSDIAWLVAEAMRHMGILSQGYILGLCHACGGWVAFGDYCWDCHNKKHRKRYAEVFFAWRILRQHLRTVSSWDIREATGKGNDIVMKWLDENEERLEPWEEYRLPMGKGTAFTWGLDWQGENWDAIRVGAAHHLSRKTGYSVEFAYLNSPESLTP